MVMVIFLAFVTMGKLPNLSVGELIRSISRVVVRLKSGQLNLK